MCPFTQVLNKKIKILEDKYLSILVVQKINSCLFLQRKDTIESQNLKNVLFGCRNYCYIVAGKFASSAESAKSKSRLRLLDLKNLK